MFNTGETTDERREQRDFVLRLIRQCMQAVAAMTSKARRETVSQLYQDTFEAARTDLDVDLTAIRFLDCDSLIAFADAKGILEPLALLLAFEAELETLRGKTGVAQRLRRRSIAMLAAARAKGYALSHEATALLQQG